MKAFGRLTNTNIISLPSNWVGVAQTSSIAVNITPIGASQDIIVQSVDSNQQITLKSNTGVATDCYYTVFALREGDPTPSQS